MPALNDTLATIFAQMAELTELLGGNRFKVIAYQRAARVLENLADDVAKLSKTQLTLIDGIGEGVADRILEYARTGHITELEAMLEQVPTGLPELLMIPGLGPKTVGMLWKQAGITSKAVLQDKLADDALAALPGFGKKKLDNLRKNLAFAAEAAKRIRIGVALPLARFLVDQLRLMPGVTQADYAGSLRRGRETVGDLDLLAAVDPAHAPAVADAFTTAPIVREIIGKGPTKCSIRTEDGLQVDLRLIPPDRYGAALLYFTGSKDHNVALRSRALDMGMTLNEYGLHMLADDPKTKGHNEQGDLVAAATEADVYRALRLDWVPPELREDRGEVELAEKHALPVLLSLHDIHAELHTHTNASDGHWALEDLIDAAVARGFHTLAVTDHSRSQVQANGLSVQRLEQHVKMVRKVAEQVKGRITVLAGSEVDILADGRLDYPDTLLAQLDLVVASPHAALTQVDDAATDRLLRALDNPYVTILGHPTGRIVGRREGIKPDMQRVVAAAAARGVALEINANYYRLDLRDLHARMALAAECKLAINTDAHGPADLDQLVFGVLTARRAGATRNDVVNCLPPDELRQWIASTRR